MIGGSGANKTPGDGTHHNIQNEKHSAALRICQELGLKDITVHPKGSGYYYWNGVRHDEPNYFSLDTPKGCNQGDFWGRIAGPLEAFIVPETKEAPPKTKEAPPETKEAPPHVLSKPSHGTQARKPSHGGTATKPSHGTQAPTPTKPFWK